MERNEEIVDVFDRVRFKWKFVCAPVESQIFNHRRQFNSTVQFEVRSFELSFHKKYKDKVLISYFPYILEKSKAIKDEKKTLKLLTANYNGYYDNPSDAWISINLDHPATFETLAIEPDLKKAVMEDLDRFVKRKEFYKSVGKAWKRGYLLYGPPGTGKSSLIAAMANYLNFDVYDLELTSVRCNSELRSLLVGTANRSILVVEDIDCSVDFQDRQGQANPSRRKEEEQNKVTLSGLLNFVDGLWSSCGDERIIVLTTNHKDRLDPALLRPGRMDMHIHMSYCTPGGFKILASNYLGIDDDDDDSLSSKVEEIQGLIKEVVEVTPAEVAEELMKNDNPQIALQCLLQFLHLKQQQKIKSMEAMSSTMAEAAAVVDGRQR